MANITNVAIVSKGSFNIINHSYASYIFQIGSVVKAIYCHSIYNFWLFDSYQ